MNADTLLSRTFLEALLPTLGKAGFFSALIVVVVSLIGWVWFFRQRQRFSRTAILTTGAISLSTILFFGPLWVIVFLLAHALLVVGIVMSVTPWSARAGVQKGFASRESAQNATRLLALGILFVYTLGEGIEIAKMSSAVIQGPRHAALVLAYKDQEREGRQVRLTFDGPMEPITFLDVLLPVEEGAVFKEGECYQVTYFYSPIATSLPKGYVTEIRRAQGCEPK